MSELHQLFRKLLEAEVRFVLIGVGGANYYARGGGQLFATQDRDLFLPPNPENLLACCQVFRQQEWELWCNREPLGEPVDLWLADKVVTHQAAVKADKAGEEIDLTLVMKGFSFEEVWAERRLFESEGVEIPVARLEHIVRSKREVGRPKDHLFFTTHADLLKELLDREVSRDREGRFR